MKHTKAVAKASGPAKSAVKTVSKQVSAPMTPAASDRKWMAEDAMRTIMRAEEHKKDKALMSDVQKLAKAQAAQLSSICAKGK